jgi:hypothetical protein
MRVLAVLVAVLLAGIYASAPAQERVAADSVKAAFLYHFAGYAQWPPAMLRADEPVVIGVMGGDAVESELRRIAPTRKVQDRPLQVVHVEPGDSLAGLHILYVGRRENPRLARILAAAAEYPILTVSDADDGLEQGAIINFVTTERVQFEISLAAADVAGLRLSSRLLAVALRVKKGERDSPGTAYAAFFEAPRTASATAAPTSAVLARPFMSGVCGPWMITCSMARTISAAASA